MNYLFVLFLLFPVLLKASPEKPSPNEYQNLLKLSYADFDQNLPKGGWRAITNNIEAGKVIDAYHLHNFDKFEAFQHRILYWHAGQAYAMGGLTALALVRFKKSYDASEKTEDNFKWNSYVRGTVAFLENDMKTLATARDELKIANDTSAAPNLKTLESLIRCFNKPYFEAYTSVCK